MTTAQSKHGGARVRVPPPLVFVGSTLLGVAIQYLVLRWSLPLGTSARMVAAGIFGALGVFLLVVSLGLFKRSGQDPAPWKPSPSMILSGPYRYSRNPIYIGMTLLQLAISLAADDAWILLLAGASLTFVHYFAVLPEEAYLTERFGEPYLQYKARVRRYL